MGSTGSSRTLNAMTKPKSLPKGLYSALNEARCSGFSFRPQKPCWLDVKMPECDEEAMKEGVRNCEAFIAIVTAPADPKDPTRAIIRENSYFSRPFCRKEICWAVEFKKPIVPVVHINQKTHIGELVKLGKEFGIDFSEINFCQFDRSGPNQTEASLKDIQERIDKQMKKPCKNILMWTPEEVISASDEEIAKEADEKKQAAAARKTEAAVPSAKDTPMVMQREGPPRPLPMAPQPVKREANTNTCCSLFCKETKVSPEEDQPLYTAERPFYAFLSYTEPRNSRPCREAEQIASDLCSKFKEQPQAVLQARRQDARRRGHQEDP